MADTGIPRYALYGEPGRAIADRFVHIETIACRSAVRDWTIRPHWHATLGHLLFVSDGGGEMAVDGERTRFGRAILTMPAGLAHGFRFDPGTVGHIVTIADPAIRALAADHPRIGLLRQGARILPWPDASGLAPLLDALAVETTSAAPLAAFAGDALLNLLLVAVGRLLPAPEPPAAAAAPRRAATLLGRYVAQVDRHFRDGWTVADHAAALGTSVARLRACCMTAADTSPIRLLHDRLHAEARRQLAFTDRTVAEIGYDLGFDDPAYFSRFFRREAGCPPSRWRERRAIEAPAGRA